MGSGSVPDRIDYFGKNLMNAKKEIGFRVLFYFNFSSLLSFASVRLQAEPKQVDVGTRSVARCPFPISQDTPSVIR